MLNLIFLIIFAVPIVAILLHAIVYYRAAQGTVWQKLLATSRDSATWLWAKVLLVAGLIIEGMAQAADFFQMPDVDSFIRTKIPVDYLGYALLAIAFMTFAARARRLLRG